MAGLLGDIFSASNTLKRKVRGLLDDPSGTLSQFVGQLGDDMNTNINNMQTGFGFGGGQSVLISPEQKAAAQRALADYGSQMGMAGATVWHGSPHKFDKFDSSKIGTGEGAQAYGHGLYLAESPDVAKSYQAMSYNRTVALPDGKGYALFDSATDKKISDTFGTKDAALKAKEAFSGNHYKVDLPDDQIAKMLDWDKPLSQQHPDVQAAFSLDKFPNNSAANMTGMEAYVKTGQMLGEPTSSSAAAAQALLKKGIPGIRYLDGGSRAGGAGTSNYVVFPGNEGLLSILERNGAPIK